MIIEVKVKAESKKEELKEISRGKLEVCIKEIPEKGKANRELLRVLSKHFGVSQSKILIKKGGRSKLKLLEIVD